MECLDCKNPYAVCRDVEGPSCHISVPMTTFYWFESVRPSHHDVALLLFNLDKLPCFWSHHLRFVPCCNRQVLGAYIEHMQSVATKENKPVGNPIFATRELLEYEVMIDHGDKRTRIHEIGWQRFLDEYAVRLGDMVYICLPRGNGRFFVEVERGGIRQLPLPCSHVTASFKKANDGRLPYTDNLIWRKTILWLSQFTGTGSPSTTVRICILS
ncbi:hypothetical protein CFC21_093459 [Triticum aestivum]|uniref:TF-B3 domain-containing protein n=2 Tax=Triticum aestivum TaxID=4565 RepID=A0A9R1LKY5_WHEAT|nr:hypothetical protein CFC21_093459 [Triticum aestivum]